MRKLMKLNLRGRLVDLFRTKQLEFGVSVDNLQSVLNPPNLNPSLTQL